jgi:hypothetical protein
MLFPDVLPTPYINFVTTPEQSILSTFTSTSMFGLIVPGVALELSSKIAISPATGYDAPPAPPDDVDQCLVSDQLPDCPTKYRVAIFV